MERKNGLLSRIRSRLFGGGTEAKTKELIISEPEQSLEQEIVQSVETIDLNEQLKMIRVAGEYAEAYVFPGVRIDPSWVKGFALKNDIFVAVGDETVSRSNMELFYQDPASGEKKIVYLLSLIRFADDPWRVFQAKEVMPTEVGI